MKRLWTASREWPGETVFLIAGGPSVTQEDVDRLRGRRVIAINSSYQRTPWADILLFGDARWWNEHRKRTKDFSGRIVTVSRCLDPRLVNMEKAAPPGLAAERTRLTMRRTSLHAAINLAVHLGAARIVLLGADMRPAADGRTHHHAPHPWPTKPNCWREHIADLRSTIEPLRKAGVEVINCSPVSLIEWWPKRRLEDVIAEETRLLVA